MASNVMASVKMPICLDQRTNAAPVVAPKTNAVQTRADLREKNCPSPARVLRFRILGPRTVAQIVVNGGRNNQ